MEVEEGLGAFFTWVMLGRCMGPPAIVECLKSELAVECLNPAKWGMNWTITSWTGCGPHPHTLNHHFLNPYVNFHEGVCCYLSGWNWFQNALNLLLWWWDWVLSHLVSIQWTAVFKQSDSKWQCTEGKEMQLFSLVLTHNYQHLKQ